MGRRQLASAVGLCVGVTWLVPARGVARADESVEPAGSAEPVEIDVPLLVHEASEADQAASDRELDLANLVQSAAKGVTTVQEAPAIVTVLTDEELRERGTRNIEEAIDGVPGWMRNGIFYSQFPYALTRGVSQAALVLQNGISMFDPMLNSPSIGRQVPLELFKRIEIITGPGGVLWGANSFLGVINLITKDADDLDGMETGAGFGDGPGDRAVFRAYAMLGQPRLFGTRAKLFAHVHYETYAGPRFEMPQHVYSSPLPRPNSKNLYGPDLASDQRRSYILNLDGKLTLGPLALSLWFPFNQRYYPMTFRGGIVREEFPEDSQCPPTDRNDPDNKTTGPGCIDPGRAGRMHLIHLYERYGTLEYRRRFAKETAGIAARAYLIQFIRAFDPIQIFAPIKNILEGGIAIQIDMTTYRTGATVDGDVNLPRGVRVIYGGEAFYEWLPDTVTRSRQGAGAEVVFLAPYDERKLPLPCPLERDGTELEDCPVTIAFETDRTVLGAYVAVSGRPLPRLILDAGLRLQAAPATLGRRSFSTLPIASAAAVYGFAPGWNLKLNYTEGFRPPVFNNTDSNGQAIAVAGERGLKVETSRSLQTEVNARVLKGQKNFRELDLRADYSYTIIENFITFAQGLYRNTAPRGIHSGEFLAKAYLKGNHRVELGYTYLLTTMQDVGAFRAMPEHWFHLSGVVTLVPGRWQTHIGLKILGAFEDPNRRVENRDLEAEMGTGHLNVGTDSQTVDVEPTDLVLDRLPPAGELQAGVRWLLPEYHLAITATATNALNARHYQPDYFHSYQPRLEFLPNPYEDFRFFVQATYDR